MPRKLHEAGHIPFAITARTADMRFAAGLVEVFVKRPIRTDTEQTAPDADEEKTDADQ